MSNNKGNSKKKETNVLPVSFKQTDYEQKLKNDILKECATLGFSTWVKHVCGLYLYTDHKEDVIFYKRENRQAGNQNDIQSNGGESLINTIKYDL